MIMHFKRQWSVYLWYLIIFIGLIITILPFWWGVAASFKSNSEIFRDLAPISYKAFLPGFSLDSYIAIFENELFIRNHSGKLNSSNMLKIIPGLNESYDVTADIHSESVNSLSLFMNLVSSTVNGLVLFLF